MKKIFTEVTKNSKFPVSSGGPKHNFTVTSENHNNFSSDLHLTSYKTQNSLPITSPNNFLGNKKANFYDPGEIKESTIPCISYSHELSPISQQFMYGSTTGITTLSPTPPLPSAIVANTAMVSSSSSSSSSSLLENNAMTSASNTVVLAKPAKSEIFIPAYVSTEELYSLATTTHENAISSTRNVVSSITPISFCADNSFRPSALTPEQHHFGAMVGAYLKAIKLGIPIEDATICAGFSAGVAGQNITKLQTISPHMPIKSPLNMVKFIPEDAFKELPSFIQEKLTKLKMHNLTLFLEIFTMIQLNPDLLIKLEPQNLKIEEILALYEAKKLENITGQVNTDYIRRLPEPVNGYEVQLYDHKSISGRMEDKNHVRPVSSQVEKYVDEAKVNLETSINNWRNAPENVSNKNQLVAELLLEDLQNISDIYKQKKNPSVYASSFNKFRDTYNQFLIEEKIPMNLVTEININQMRVDGQSQELFNKIFNFMQNNPDSPWLLYVNQYMKKNNGVIGNFDTMLKGFAKDMFISSNQ